MEIFDIETNHPCARCKYNQDHFSELHKKENGNFRLLETCFNCGNILMTELIAEKLVEIIRTTADKMTAANTVPKNEKNDEIDLSNEIADSGFPTETYFNERTEIKPKSKNFKRSKSLQKRIDRALVETPFKDPLINMHYSN